MISTAEALARCLALTRALEPQTVPLARAGGRVLAQTIAAKHDQPPFATSVMDGYALQGGDTGATFRVVGRAPAGHPWSGTLGPGEALRIFTGAPVPDGATRVVIQEDVVAEGDRITIAQAADPGPYIRAAGADFRAGDIIAAPRRLSAADIALAAAMGHADLAATRPPDVAILATGDELVPPGVPPREGQIVASNHVGLLTMARAAGAVARLLPIARDTPESLNAALDLVEGADLLVTIGGASVGDHDIVGEVAATRGLDRVFYRIAMRPGKPLMAGRMGATALLGVPGNPVSAMVCGQIFMVPMIEAFLGLAAGPAPRRTGILGAALPANGPREHYMRASLSEGPGGPHLTPADSQDSALLSRLATADVLIVRAPHQPAAAPGESVEFIPIRG